MHTGGKTLTTATLLVTSKREIPSCLSSLLTRSRRDERGPVWRKTKPLFSRATHDYTPGTRCLVQRSIRVPVIVVFQPDLESSWRHLLIAGAHVP